MSLITENHGCPRSSSNSSVLRVLLLRDGCPRSYCARTQDIGSSDPEKRKTEKVFSCHNLKCAHLKSCKIGFQSCQAYRGGPYDVDEAHQRRGFGAGNPRAANTTNR